MRPMGFSPQGAQRVNEWLAAVEVQMRIALATQLTAAVGSLSALMSSGFDGDKYLSWIDTYPAQLVVLAAQVCIPFPFFTPWLHVTRHPRPSLQVLWTQDIERALTSGSAGLAGVVNQLVVTLTCLADAVLTPKPPVQRKKLEHLITGTSC